MFQVACAGGADHHQPATQCQLAEHRPDATGGAVHHDHVTGGQLQFVERGDRALAHAAQSTGQGPVDPIGLAHQAGRVGEHQVGVRALGTEADHRGADGELGGGGLDHHAGELRAEDQRWLSTEAAGAAPGINRVQAAGADGNQHGARRHGGCLMVFDGDHLGGSERAGHGDPVAAGSTSG